MTDYIVHVRPLSTVGKRKPPKLTICVEAVDALHAGEQAVELLARLNRKVYVVSVKEDTE